MRLLLTLLFACALSASGATYYIDYGAADDSANGTSTSTPWKRCPGMNGFAGSYSHTAGDRFIFKGGVTWPSAALNLDIENGGGSGNSDYYGVDPAWYSGGAWSRPVFDFEKTYVGHGVYVQASYVTIDNLDLKNHRGAADFYGMATISVLNSVSVVITNCLIRDWTIAVDDVTATFGGVFSYDSDVEVTHCTLTQVGTSPAQRGGPACWNVQKVNHSEIYETVTAINSVTYAHHNHIHNLVDASANPAADVHGNAIQTFDDSYIYNNVIHDLHGITAPLILSGHSVVYNNVLYNCGGQGPIGTTANIGFGDTSETSLKAWNNTIVDSGWAIVSIEASVFDCRNNLVINGVLGYDTFKGEDNLSETIANNLVLTPAQATALGFTTNDFYRTPLGTAASGAGADLSAFFTIDRLDVARSVPWDIGAYELTDSWYVSPSGSSSGAGTLASPWDIATGLNSNAVTSGDMVYGRGGTYGVGTNVFLCTHKGMSNNPIIIRNYPGERMIIDGGIKAESGTSSNVWFWGLEITCSTGRTNTLFGRPPGLTINGMGCGAINNIIHDTGHPGIGSFATISGGKQIYGNIIWGTGMYQYHVDGDGISEEWTPENLFTRGAGTYLQNSNGTFTVADNISGRNVTEGQKAYAESLYANGFIFDGNITFRNNVASIMVDCLYNTLSNCTVINNFDYRSIRTRLGDFNDGNLAVKYGLFYSNNYTVQYPSYRQAALWFKQWGSLSSFSNTVVTASRSNEWATFTTQASGDGTGGMLLELFPWTNGSPTYVIDRNKYYGGIEEPFWGAGNSHPFRYYTPDGELTTEHTFATWTNTRNFDINGSYSANLPTANIVTIRTNKYEPGRAHIVVYNWASNSTVTVNLATAGLTNGQRYEIRDAQNYLGTPIVAASTYSGGTVELSLTSTNITPITGDIEHKFLENPNIHTASLFNTFVVLPLGDAPAAPRTLNVNVRINAGSVR